MKGMAYTPFAVLATSMMFLMFISPLDVYPESVNQDIGSVETAQTLDSSVKNSFSESFGLTVNEHLQEFNEGLSSSVTDAQTDFSDEYDPDSGSHYSLNQVETDLNDVFQSEVRRDLNLNAGDSFSFSASGLTIESSVTLDYSFTDNIVDTNNALNRTVTSQASIDGAKDPFAEFQAGEDVEYSYCGYDKPAYLAGSGGSSSNSVISAEVVYRPEDPGSVSNKGEKVIFIESADGIQASTLDAFAAVVLEDSSYSNEDYVQDFDLDRQVNTGENVIIDANEVYVSYFREILDNQCFVESGNAPDIFDRMENDSSASDQGIMTIIPDSSSFGSPNEDYLYYSSRGPDGSTVNVTGLNSNENNFDERPWVNLDRENLVDWNLESLEE
ncbi:MAG: hypothetical protein R6V35_00565 [Candidatus Nanohaloarchaea archaeon]